MQSFFLCFRYHKMKWSIPWTRKNTVMRLKNSYAKSRALYLLVFWKFSLFYQTEIRIYEKEKKKERPSEKCLGSDSVWKRWATKKRKINTITIFKVELDKYKSDACLENVCMHHKTKISRFIVKRLWMNTFHEPSQRVWMFLCCIGYNMLHSMLSHGV